jgi:hypothetical protein
MANTRRGGPAGGARPRRSTREAKVPSRGRSTRGAPARRRAKARRIFVPLVVVGIVAAVIVGFVAASLTSGGTTTASEGSAPTAVVNQVTGVPLEVLNQVGESRQATALQPVRDGSPLSIDGKPGIVFVSEESCPFCAAERWPVVIALSHFGTWHHLGATTSSASDVYPSTATFSFRNATFESPDLAVRTTELANNAGRPLQALTASDSELINRYDVPPYVNSADQSGAVPFLDIDNHEVLAGAQYNPQVLAGLSMSQIAAQLDNPASPVAIAIDESANALIVAIDQALHFAPARG